MNAQQIHLALTHVPVILSFTGLVLLLVSISRKSEELLKTSYYILVIAGLSTIPVFFSGEGSEELIEKLPGVSESSIEKHEEAAQLALIVISISGIISFAGLVLRKFTGLAKMIRVAALLFAFGSAAVMAQAAHLGGQIRHSEIRNVNASQTEGPSAVSEEKNETD